MLIPLNHPLDLWNLGSNHAVEDRATAAVFLLAGDPWSNFGEPWSILIRVI
jgi:hypothetical protein